MKWIGLTGGLASGKSTVSKILVERGWPVVDADRIAREVVGPGSVGLDQVLAEFGSDLLTPDQSLDRRELGRRVFGRPDALRRLEAIIHPLVQERSKQEREGYRLAGAKVAFYDVPLLFERNLTGFDGVMVVICSEQTQRRRLRERDGLSDAEIDARLASQIPLEKKRGLADFVVENEGTLDDLKRAVENLMPKILGP